MTMMLMVDRAATEDQQGDNNMMTDGAEEVNDNMLVGKPLPAATDGDGGDDTDTQGMSSSDADYRPATLRDTRKDSRRHKSRSPTGGDSSSSSSKKPRQARSKIRPRGGVSSTNRFTEDATGDDQDRRSSRSDRHRRSIVATVEENASESIAPIVKTAKPSRDEKAKANHERDLSASGMPKPSAPRKRDKRVDKSKGRDDTKQRRRRSTLDDETDNDESSHMTSNEALPPSENSSSRQKHTVASSSSCEPKALRSRSKSRSRSSRLVKASDPGKAEAAGGNEFTHASTTNKIAASVTAPSEPTLNLKSSIKVASALVKFRKVLAMSKQASASAQQKHKVDQGRQAHEVGEDEIEKRDIHGSRKENAKDEGGTIGVKERSAVGSLSGGNNQLNRDAGSSHHRRDHGSSRQKRSGTSCRERSIDIQLTSSSHHKREARKASHQGPHGNESSTRTARMKEPSDHTKSRRTKDSSGRMKDSSGRMKDPSGRMKDSKDSSGGNNDRDSSGRTKESRKVMKDTSNSTDHNLKDSPDIDIRSKSPPPLSLVSVPGGQADDFFSGALKNVGMRLARSSGTLKKDASLKAVSSSETPSKPAAQESAASSRMKSSAKVSTAVLKFQQALALSKSATQAAKTQQDTQYKLLCEVHGDKRKPTDYMARKSFLDARESRAVASNKNISSSSILSPVSAVDVVEPATCNGSPKVPSDLDGEGDSDIDSEIEIDDVDDDDDPVSDVDTDSDDENGNSPRADIVHSAPVVTPVSSFESNDGDSDSDVDGHSDVEIDSDDDLDSDQDLTTHDTAATKEKAEDSDSVNEAEIDGDDDIPSSDIDEETPKPSNAAAPQGEYRTPTQSFVNAVNAPLLRSEIKGDDDPEASAANADGSNKEAEISNRLLLVHPMSYQSDAKKIRTLPSSLSVLDKSVASEVVPSANSGPGLSIPGLSPGSKASLDTDEESHQISYLPVSMKKPHQCFFPAFGYEKEDSSSDTEMKAAVSDSETNRKSRKDLVRRPSRNSSGRTRPNPEDQKPGARSSSRVRRWPSRSRSSSRAMPEGGKSHHEGEKTKSQTFSSRSDKGRTSDRTKAKENGEILSTSRHRTIAALSSISTAATATTNSSGNEMSDIRDKNRKVSSRHRVPNRSKSHDVRGEVRKSSRSMSRSKLSENGDG